MARCDVCDVRVGPCVDEHGVPMAQYQEQRKAAIRERVAARSKP